MKKHQIIDYQNGCEMGGATSCLKDDAVLYAIEMNA